MKIGAVSGMMAVALTAAVPGISSSLPNATDVPTQMVITVLPAKGGAQPASLDARDLRVLQGKKPVPVIRLQRLAGVAFKADIHRVAEAEHPAIQINLNRFDFSLFG